MYAHSIYQSGRIMRANLEQHTVNAGPKEREGGIEGEVERGREREKGDREREGEREKESGRESRIRREQERREYVSCVCVCTCVHACVCVCVRACMHACITRFYLCIYLLAVFESVALSRGVFWSLDGAFIAQ